MIPFIVNKKKIKVKSSWDDVSYGEYLQILEAGKDTAKVVSILTGIDAALLGKANIGGVDQLLLVISFVNNPIDPVAKLTQVGPYKLPLKGGKFDVQFESLGQFEDLRTVMSMKIKDPLDVLKSYVPAVAIYLQKIRDGEYDTLKAQDMEPEVLTLPAREVLTAGSFFLARLLSLYNGIKGNYQKSVKARERIGKRSRKSSARTRPSTGRRGR